MKPTKLVPRLRVRKGATMKEMYKAAHKQLTAEELQRFTVIEPMVPAEQLLAELEAICNEKQLRPAKKKKKRK